MEKIHLALSYFTQTSTIQKIVKADHRRRYLFFHAYSEECYISFSPLAWPLVYILRNEIFEPRVGMTNDFYLWHPSLTGELVVGWEANIPIL